MARKRILSLQEYIEKLKLRDSNDVSTDVSHKEAKPIDEDNGKPKRPGVKAGNFVEDRYGNRYKVAEVTDINLPGRLLLKEPIKWQVLQVLKRWPGLSTPIVFPRHLCLSYVCRHRY